MDGIMSTRLFQIYSHVTDVISGLSIRFDLWRFHLEMQFHPTKGSWLSFRECLVSDPSGPTGGNMSCTNVT